MKVNSGHIVGLLQERTHPFTHTHPFNGPLSGTTQVSRYQKGKTNWILLKQESGWQWHQLGYMQVCTSLQTDNHTSTPPLLYFFTGRMPFLPPNQQRQNTEGTTARTHYVENLLLLASCQAHQILPVENSRCQFSHFYLHF